MDETAPLALRLVEIVPTQDAGTWQPFTPTPGFTTHWWANIHHLDGSGRRHRFFSVVDERIDGDFEVARLELHPDQNFPEWLGHLHASQPLLEIQLIEVHGLNRGDGIGRGVIELLREAFPQDILVALSTADRFWERIGWRRFERSDDDPFHPSSPLYLGPT